LHGLQAKKATVCFFKFSFIDLIIIDVDLPTTNTQSSRQLVILIKMLIYLETFLEVTTHLVEDWQQ